MHERPRLSLTLLILAECAVMSLWFSATAVLPDLAGRWDLGPDGKAALSYAVSLGFVAGTLLLARLDLADRVSSRLLIAAGAVLGAVVNAGLLLVPSLAPALALRFLTGMFLACVYPPGMRLAASLVPSERRGLAVGLLVGALTLGSASPHLLAVVLAEGERPLEAVVLGSSLLAVASALVVAAFVREGPYARRAARFDPQRLGRVVRTPSLRLASFGYFGHMWELYAFWSWVVVFVREACGLSEDGARLLGFATIGVAGALGAGLGGWCADRLGRTRWTILALAVSGGCCLLSPLLPLLPFAALVAVLLLWGAAVITDSAQFSAAISELAEPDEIGVALTMQTAVGFALTMPAIWLLPRLAELVGWQFAFVMLVPGPVLGLLGMARLRRLPDALRMAGGRR